MALAPIDDIHALQIQAGILGRNTGHKFEDQLVSKINHLPDFSFLNTNLIQDENIFQGCPAINLLRYVFINENLSHISSIKAISTGALATSEAGKKILHIDGHKISRCKSDLILSIETSTKKLSIGISIKQCNTLRPTNAQLYFTTATGFSNMLLSNGISITQHATNALKEFCGEPGFSPLDNPLLNSNRVSDPRRYFWEEINYLGKMELEHILSKNQDYISKLLFQKAYLDDPFYPEYILHKTKKSGCWDSTEVAIYSIDELILKSRQYNGFYKKPYSVRKGTFKDPAGVTHEAPRFGIIQMQRGGQKQHPTQLQFNLEAGYFYKI